MKLIIFSVGFPSLLLLGSATESAAKKKHNEKVRVPESSSIYTITAG